jgi:hypothetical protein
LLAASRSLHQHINAEKPSNQAAFSFAHQASYFNRASNTSIAQAD